MNINQLGLLCATEFLDPLTPQFLADLIAWVAIGARTTESQTHRQMASGLPIPIGFKNGTCGRLSTAFNAIVSAQHPHTFLGVNDEGLTSIVQTKGNPDCHIVLRGAKGKPNYGATHVAHAQELMNQAGIPRGVMVDCSHGNSEKDYTRQADVCRDVIRQYCQEDQKAIMGLMLESNLYQGNQKWKKGKTLKSGVSITDGCIGWEETKNLLYQMAEMLKNSRN